MPLTDDELNNLEAAAYLCDGEPFSFFEQNVLPKLATHSVGELWAMSGKFLNREMLDIARFIAAYARVAEHAEIHDKSRPDPRLFLRRFDAEQLQRRIEAVEDTAELPF
jgi:hypothetical protein